MNGNAPYAIAGPPLALNAFIIGDFFLVDTERLSFVESPQGMLPRFDAEFLLKEDYAWAVDLARAGVLTVRTARVLCGAEHRATPGGAVDRRTSTLEKKMVSLLKARSDLIVAGRNELEVRTLQRPSAAVVEEFAWNVEMEGHWSALLDGRAQELAGRREEVHFKARGLVSRRFRTRGAFLGEVRKHFLEKGRVPLLRGKCAAAMAILT